MKYNNILETIGNTPIVEITNYFENSKAKVFIKIEKANPGGSIKDRIALAMIKDAEEKNLINSETTIIEPTSGNTGVGLAMVCAVLGYKLIITMPESMSIERRKLMTSYGAQIELTPKEKGMKGAIEKALELQQSIENSWIPMQFENASNVKIHEETTVKEILNDFDNLNYIVTGVGTGGHITACANILKNKFSNLNVIAVEPNDSPVLSGGNPSSHPIQGIGAGFIPKVLNVNLLDRVIKITKEEAFHHAKNFAKKTGILCGISTGASIAAVTKVLEDCNENDVILTFNYDTGERYFSVPDLY